MGSKANRAHCSHFLRVPFALLLGAILFVLPSRLSAQTVQGHLTDGRTRFALSVASVALRDEAGAVVARTEVNFLGAFRFDAPGPGIYSVLVESMGYRSTESDPFELVEGEVTTVDLYVFPQPIELDSLTVHGKSQRVAATLRKQGFYDRQQQGMGSYLTPEQIRRWPAVSVGDVLRHAPFVELQGNGIQGNRILIRKFGTCQPTIYVDGNRIQGSPDDWTRPEDIVAVEVYRGLTQIPLEWGGNETCGVILIWTSFGRGGG